MHGGVVEIAREASQPAPVSQTEEAKSKEMDFLRQLFQIRGVAQISVIFASFFYFFASGEEFASDSLQLGRVVSFAPNAPMDSKEVQN